MALLKWPDRQFQFGFSREYFPFFIERLRATAPRLDEMTVLVPEDLLEQRDEGHWSIKEHIGHLADIEVLHEGRLEDFRNNQELRPADMENKVTNAAHHNQYPLYELVYHFRQVRDTFIKRLLLLTPEELAQSSLHPRLKQLVTPVDMAYFIGEHDNHHLTAIAQLLTRHS